MFREHFSGAHLYQKQGVHLQRKLERERFRTQLVTQQLQDYRQDVAAILPEVLRTRGKGEAGYPVRGLASTVLQNSNDQLSESKANAWFEKGRREFRKRKFSEASKTLEKFVKVYPFSVKLVEAYFLLAESQFQLRKFTQCIATVELMVQLYPESELTGFALLRTGKVFEFQERPEDAIEVYKTVLRSFPVRSLASQARESLSQVEM